MNDHLTLTTLMPATIGETEASAAAGDPILDRRAITDPDAIVEAMMRDILSARRDGRHAVLIDLTEHGWSPAQAQRFGSQAHAAALDPRVVTQDTVIRLMEREGRHGVSARTAARITAEARAAVAAALGVDPTEGDAA